MGSTSLPQFVIMPARGIRSGGTNSKLTRTFLTTHAAGAISVKLSGMRKGPKPKIRILDSIHEDGPKLIEASNEGAMALRADQPGLRIVPVVYYTPALAPRPQVLAKPKATTAATGPTGVKITLQVVSKADGSPVADATVVAFTDFSQRLGAQGTTNKSGQVHLALGASTKKLDRLYIYPNRGFWSLLKKDIALTSGKQVALAPLDLSVPDAVQHFYGTPQLQVGNGVTVGVVDSGVDTSHPDLQVAGGVNTVQGENPNDFGDNGGHHGTHVAGIITARGSPPTGRLGIAPSASLRSYRVFGSGSDRASNFAIAKAIDRAVADGCDLINMSLGGGPPDPLTQAAIADARSSGTLVIVAAGNDDRSPVSFPAADERAVAISAMGRKGTFPGGTVEVSEIAPPFGTDKKNFIAAFSNIGVEIDLTGTGVGIISTVPGGYVAMSGTSMACPAVTGFAARVLSGLPALRNMARAQARSDAIAKALLSTPPRKKVSFCGHAAPDASR